MAALHRLQQHNNLYEYMLDLWLSTHELVIHRCFDGDYLRWLRLRTLKAHRNCDKSKFFLYQKDFPSPKISSYVDSCTPDMLVLKGKMIYHHADRPDKFKLQFKSDTKSRLVKYRGILSISGNEELDVVILRENHSSREDGLYLFDYGSTEISIGARIWWKEHCMGTFEGWHSAKQKQLKLRSGSTVHHPPTGRCLAVLPRPIERRRIEEGSTDDSTDTSSDTDPVLVRDPTSNMHTQ